MISDETETDETDDEGAAPTLYLVWHDPAATPDAPLDLHGDGHPLAEGLWLIRSPLTRSKLYHRIKWQSPARRWTTIPRAGPSSRGWRAGRWRG